jgi:prepilin peptidase CpaA
MDPEFVHAGGCALFLGAMAWAAVSDLLTMRIANRVSGGLALGYVALAPLAGASAVEIGLAAIAAAAVLAAGFAALAFGVMDGD